jgi:sulfur carrier protein
LIYFDRVFDLSWISSESKVLMNKMMELIINGKTREVESQTLSQLLLELKLGSNFGLAVAINDELVPRSKWDSEELSDRDQVTLIRAAAGG